MSGTSKQTRVVSFRLSNEVCEIIERRARKGKGQSVSVYLRDRITYDTLRKHGGKGGQGWGETG